MKWRKVAAVVLLLVFLPVLSRADYAQFYFENDILDPVDGTDRWYTDGWRLGYGFGEEHMVFVGQNMYTASDISIPLSEPPVGDRRYAAWLYAGYARWWPEWVDGAKTYTELTLGVTGPSALGEGTQKAIHELTNSTEPMGWDSQKDEDELAVQGYVKHQWSVLAGGRKGGDIHVGAALGNLVVAPEIGIVGKVGRGVTEGLPFDAIAVKAEPTPALYGYIGTVVRYVIHDEMLEQSDVNPRDTVLDIMLGVVWETKSGISITYQWTERTTQFTEQEEAARFGAIGLRYAY